MGDDGGRGVARNEAIFRLVNEDIEDLASGAEVAKFEIVCECGSAGCVEMISVTREAYEAVRTDPERFFVKHGHVFPDVETVVEEHEPVPDRRQERPASLPGWRASWILGASSESFELDLRRPMRTDGFRFRTASEAADERRRTR